MTSPLLSLSGAGNLGVKCYDSFRYTAGNQSLVRKEVTRSGRAQYGLVVHCKCLYMSRHMICARRGILPLTAGSVPCPCQGRPPTVAFTGTASLHYVLHNNAAKR
ncbi:hypothetical protein J6590_046064 [Homalodisca vitripennis]|nr:hypothetical protein J6590_046064 [Homalodisca vitripennis]